MIACSAVKCEARKVGVTACALGHRTNARGQLGHLLIGVAGDPTMPGAKTFVPPRLRSAALSLAHAPGD